jgi:hypothetical protein
MHWPTRRVGAPKHERGKNGALHKLSSLCHLSVPHAGEFHVGFWRQLECGLVHNNVISATNPFVNSYSNNKTISKT